MSISHFLVNEHVGFGALNVRVWNSLYVVVGAEKPSGPVDFRSAGGRAFPESDKVSSGVVDAQMGDDGDQMVNVVAGGEISVLGIAQDRRSGHAASAEGESRMKKINTNIIN